MYADRLQKMSFLTEAYVVRLTSTLRFGRQQPACVDASRSWASRFGHNGGFVMKKKKTGHCLCGAVRFDYEGEVLTCVHCHCESCRRATSSPFTTWITVQRENFCWTSALPKQYASSPGVTRTFCPTCGSPMSYENIANPNEIDIYAASLDDYATIQPQRHDFWSERVNWVHVADVLEKREV